MTCKKAAAFVVCCIVFTVSVPAQKPDSIPVLGEVVVSGIRVSPVNETSLNIQSLPKSKIAQLGSLNIADALAHLPGISQLTTGPAITKPVIRGLYGNRILAVLSGLKFDNQQWQDEHGLGLTDVGIDRIEVIRGPAALLYGSEAIGGVLNIIEEQPAAPGTKESDVNAGLYSNTLGVSADGGLKVSTGNRSWGFRAGLNSNADYSDGTGKRIRNSRYGGYYLKAFLGWQRGKWTSMNHFTSSLNNFGFITEDNANSFLQDGRWSRNMGGPHHTVLLNVVSSENTIRRKHSELEIDAGIQSNLRMENEGDHKISLNMLLSTLLWRVAWKKMVATHTELIVSNNSQFENNTNFGSRIIIPDANLFESGISVFLRHHLHKVVIEAGAGASLRSIHTIETAGVNTPGKSIRPFDKTKPSINGSLGVALNPSAAWTVKANAGTGFRSGNLAELSSDGLHEGTLRYEIGDPDLKIEQNVMGEFSIAWHRGSFEASANIFYNRFFNYIYLDPAGTTYLGFEVFRFRQFDASLAGSEDRVALNLPALGMMHIESNFSTVRGKLAGGANLPFIPPSRWMQEARYPWHAKNIENGYAFVNVTTTYRQDHPAEFETSTAGYTLLNAGIGASLHMGNRTVTINIAGNNLLNKNYYDHLSRFRDYGIHNIGRNVVVHVHIPLDDHLKIKS